MNYSLSDTLKDIENEIIVKYTNDGKLTGLIKTPIISSPTDKEFLQLKRDLKQDLKINENIYIDDIDFKYGKYLRDDVFNKKHEWDILGIICTIGIITPFLVPKLIKDLYEYYTSDDYNFISYEIKIRESNVTSE